MASEQPKIASLPTEVAPSRSALPTPFLTWLAIAASALIFLGINFGPDPRTELALNRLGYVSADRLWSGAYWGLITSVFVHMDFVHFIFNVYWLYQLGSRLEQAIGHISWLLFFLSAAVVSSALQLTMGSSTGIGASGVAYAIFGFMWVTRSKFPRFREILDDRTIGLFVIWLVGCMAVTALGIWSIGNVAHTSGLLFGLAVGACYAGYRPKLMAAAAAILIATSVATVFWSPWSMTWLSVKALQHHKAERYEQAIGYYNRMLGRDPNNAWALHNRGSAEHSLGRLDEAEKDLKRAREIDPTFGH